MVSIRPRSEDVQDADAPAAVTGAVTHITWIDGGGAFEYDRGDDGNESATA